MKIRLAYLLIFLVSVLSFVSASEGASSPVSKPCLKYIAPATTYSSASITAAIGPRLSGQSGAQGSLRGETDTQIKQTTDVVMHGSIVPACDAILSLIAVLHQQKVESFPQILDPPTRRVLFKLLFRVIIAPNAP